MVASASNLAVDNLMEKILNHSKALSGGGSLLRVGHPSRVTGMVTDFTLERMIGACDKEHFKPTTRFWNIVQLT